MTENYQGGWEQLASFILGGFGITKPTADLLGETMVPCQNCCGTGKIGNETYFRSCAACDGSGRVEKQQEYPYYSGQYIITGPGKYDYRPATFEDKVLFRLKAIEDRLDALEGSTNEQTND